MIAKNAVKLVTFALLILPRAGSAQVSTPVLYSVQSPSGQVVSYLFGTFHYGIGLNEFPDYLRRAQDQTQMQFAEDNMIPIANLLKMARTQPRETVERFQNQYGVPKNPTPFTSQELDKLVNLGIPREFAMAMQDENCFFFVYRKFFFLEPFHSLEAELEERAVAAGKQIVELDSEALREEAYKNEAPSTCRVRDYLNNPAALKEADQMVEDIRNQYRHLTPDLALQLQDDSDDTVTLRTEAWMKTLVPAMQKQPAFISVGLDHLLGPKGLIQLLQAQGFAIKPYHP